jgi:predicted lactoylglutathione lyase
MRQALSMVMLAVDDLVRTRLFYEQGLKWEPWGGGRSHTSVKYLAGDVLVTMIDRHYVAKEGGLAEGSGLFGIVCVVNVASQDEVDGVLKEVAAAGGMITNPARFRDGGLYSFYFTDPDRNPWEVVWNPKAPAESVLQAM